MNIEPFAITTCEAYTQSKRALPFSYEPSSPLTPFEISDPFSLRKAIVPVFRRDPTGQIYGMGTAFHVDGWGGFLTADHVVDFFRDAVPRGTLNPDSNIVINPLRYDHAVLLLGVGVVFGSSPIPEWAFSPIVRHSIYVSEKDNPLASLRGESVFQVAADVAGMQALFATDAEVPHSLPVRINGWQPVVGEYVFAVGYPQLKPNDAQNEQSLCTIVEDGMYGAYGRITNIFQYGRDSANPTPVFEVEADWRSGMSGGPVFNQRGEVIGIVSRSLAPDGDSNGIGYAACLGWTNICRLLPTLDANNPGNRVGYGVLRLSPWHLAGVFPTELEATKFATLIGNDYQVILGSHQIGSDEFIW